MELIIVTGLSGAGKSQATHCLEDLGYYCVDNMPPVLIDEFLKLAEGRKEMEKIAFVIDVRGGDFLEDIYSSLDKLEAENLDYKIMYLEASDAVLVRRFKETRRRHPLSSSVAKGLSMEREALKKCRERASFIIDTSNLKAAGLNKEIKRLLGSDDQENFIITLESFGFKNGMPAEADWVADARFIPNPYYVASLKKLTGNNKKVRDYVMGFEESEHFVARLCGLITELIPSYKREGKYQLTLAVGCTGGRHRSVAVVNSLAEHFREQNKQVVVIHRDL